MTCSDEEPRVSSGVLYFLADLQEAEARIVRLLTGYLEAEDRSVWVRANFDFPYPEDATTREVISDIVSRELDASFTSVFRCPHCGRIATNEHNEANWKFFEAASATQEENQ